MKNLLSSLFVLFYFGAFCQYATLTPTLHQKLKLSKNGDILKVNIVFSKQVDYNKLKAKFKKENTPLSERAKTVIREATKLAEKEQKSIIDFLTKNSKEVSSYQQLWIINMITVEASKEIVEHLSYHPELDYIEEFDYQKTKPIDIIKSRITKEKSVNGIEPGLVAIKAPSLWAMGYSGKGRKFLSIDTGVWKDHPSISDNWLGNYQPINQAWHGIDSPVPTDKVGSHGTHTTGTVLGLDRLNNDTIGVAFNAYFMAADPVVTDVADIPPLTETIANFQIALNPDGDTATTDDIPDAINNSWGRGGASHDISICGSYVNQMFDAVEAAGIANIFSAGNNGPNDTTIGQPQYVSTGLVNTFTVGAIAGADTSFPIAGFSSRGPTACPLPTGPLKIKPEVVAPGVNVRSSVNETDYAIKSGTSMAAPHVTGAVLLLKEAFPSVSGEEILLALYNTAIDLGVAGEDNTYGRGMIDVLAAFNYLSLTYTPIPPSQYHYDISVSEILLPFNETQCNQSFSPKFTLKNKGDSTINNAVITYQLNDEATNTFNWTGTLNSGDTTSISLPTINALGYGDYELIIKASIDSAKIECDYVNNQRVHRFNIRTIFSTLPFSENFEQMRIDSSEWFVKNPDGLIGWDTTETDGLPNSSHSATMQMTPYSGSKQLDDLTTPNISLPPQDSIFLRFDVAYQMLTSFLADTMSVFISTDCGANFTGIYKKGGIDLQTHDTITPNFTPKYSHHWRREYIDITPYANKDVLIKFQTFNKSGNNLYLDNIWIYEGEEPVSVKENNPLNEVRIYPNPTQNQLNIDLNNNDLTNANIDIINLLGKVVYQQKVIKDKVSINTYNFSNGVYLVKFSNAKGNKVYRIIKN